MHPFNRWCVAKSIVGERSWVWTPTRMPCIYPVASQVAEPPPLDRGLKDVAGYVGSDDTIAVAELPPLDADRSMARAVKTRPPRRRGQPCRGRGHRGRASARSAPRPTARGSPPASALQGGRRTRGPPRWSSSLQLLDVHLLVESLELLLCWSEDLPLLGERLVRTGRSYALGHPLFIPAHANHTSLTRRQYSSLPDGGIDPYKTLHSRHLVATVVGRGSPQEGIHDAFQGATLSTRLHLHSNVEPLIHRSAWKGNSQKFASWCARSASLHHARRGERDA
jgi:hypothetical protein